MVMDHPPLAKYWGESSSDMSRQKAAAKKRELGQLYECPIYKYPSRTDKYRLAMADLKCGDKDKSHWTLRGVALLANTS